MYQDNESSGRRLPSLVQICQRVASTHVDFINNLGDHLRYSLVKPILERCSTDHLLRLEQASPHLCKDTPEIWKDLCIRKYPTAVERYAIDSDAQEPESWKDCYFLFQEAEAKRLEEVGSRLRSQRLEADERKKEREVKITDRVPPPKRQRSGWSTNVQPKTLFQKTKTEASKIQKAMYNARVLPPMPGGKNYRVLPSPDARLPSVPSSDIPSRVTVNTVIQRRPAHVSSLVSTSTQSSSRSQLLPISPPTVFPAGTSTLSAAHLSVSSPPSPSKKSLSTSPPKSKANVDSRPFKSPQPLKKDPMASLFLPKNKAYSQRPV